VFHILKEEILKIVRRKQFWIMFMILFMVSIIDFLVTCKCFYGVELTWVRSAYQCTILKNTVSSFTVQFFTTLFPLVVSIAVSDIYYEEQATGINNFIYTRMEKNKNIYLKMISLSVVVFVMILIPLMTNLLLTLTAFPTQGHYSANITYLTLIVHSSDRILAGLEASHPYLNITMYILIRCLLGVFMALLSFSVSLLNQFNRYIILFSSMIFFLIYTLITGISGSVIISTDVMGINTYGSIFMIFAFMALLCIFIGIFTFVGRKRENY